MLSERLTKDRATSLKDLARIVGEMVKYCHNNFVECDLTIELWTDENGDFVLKVQS